MIPKTVTDSGNALTLADVQWANDGTYYTATASYTGSATSRYATGYTVKADYTGEVAKTNCEVVTYTAIFGSTEISEDGAGQIQALESDPAANSETAANLEPAAELEPAINSEPGQSPKHENGSAGILALLGCLGGGAALAAAITWSTRKIKGRRDHE